MIPDVAREALARLPPRVTLHEIASATGRTPDTVRVHWAPRPGFPPGTRDSDGQVRRDRDAVLTWYLEQPLSDPDHVGGNKASQRAATLPPLDVALTTGQIAGILDLTPGAVASYYTVAYGPDAADPFPPADSHGLRPWPPVRQWLLRHGPGTGPATETEPAPTQTLPDSADASWLADRLGISTTTALAVLRQTQGTRLRRTALAASVGLTPAQVTSYARIHGPDCDDPFPAVDADYARDVDEVRDWLGRHGRKSREQVVADLTALPARATADQVAAALGVSAGILRKWAKHPAFPAVQRDGNARYRDRGALITWHRQHATQEPGAAQP